MPEPLFTTAYHPIAPLTWEARAVLPGTQLESERVEMTFPQNAIVVGFLPYVIPLPVAAGGPALRTPTTQDIDVKIDRSLATHLTAANGVTIPGTTGRDDNYVTLQSLGVQALRLVRYAVKGPSPKMGFQFRWSIGANIYQGALIKVSALVDFEGGS